ncbi:hypothetical protein BDZ94DRAFT_1165033 [Collybia nuda]|uniref:Uncharacterized protein n=1 Tax=Collybia nuda TaxID=64659 RepID=A0A9P5Y683_9AGAR|nr:hypothetical protein BDZ94DRAFT_1165033 [Collybia nuda]
MNGHPRQDGDKETVPADLVIFSAGINATSLRQLRLSAIGPSLTAVLPINFHSLSMLEDLLVPFLKSSKNLREIMIICPEKLILQTQGALHNTVSSTVDHPDISLHALLGGSDFQSGIVEAISRVATDWILLMDHEGLLQQSDSTVNDLLHPPTTPVPFGPRGVIISPFNISCILSVDGPEKASYLLPPFLVPTFFTANGLSYTGSDIWISLGRRIADSSSDGTGGIVINTYGHNVGWCPTSFTTNTTLGLQNPVAWGSSILVDRLHDPCLVRKPSANFGVFFVFLPTVRDLQLLSPLLCLLQSTGHSVHMFVYDDYDELRNTVGWETHTYIFGECLLTYTIISGHITVSPNSQAHTTVLDWLSTSDVRPDIVIGPSHEVIFDKVVTFYHETLRNATIVRIPKEDFPHCVWMGSLSKIEWQAWEVPRIEISIITKDRPRSLLRLLQSISNGRYFGDAVNLRINLEQSADTKTLKLVEGFSWPHGVVFVHHRVIHGGLLAAVVESWYPMSNDTYGLLLEDDVELSPLFYAWAKMSLLRYRYGNPGNRSSRLFGISLYQQKNVELPLEGRQAFNARLLFTKTGFLHPTTPYLSPVPCSWGAVYFPEHWREFHAYLSFRLSEHSMKFNQDIVPGVRSNRWTKSWKKYFIEMVYLRGYVMLYPNYENFLSLSTNHLEVGSHVKVRTREKRDLFVLPLMQLPISISLPVPSLLDLPYRTLPAWNALPVLNLTGSLTTLNVLTSAGALRRRELTGCVNEPIQYDVWDLMCIGSRSP